MSEKFDMHCVVELFGHQKIAGRVTEQAIGGATFLRVEVPKTTKRDGFTRFYGASAVYSITPVDEQIAGLMADRSEVEPVSEWMLSLALRDKLIPATTGPAPDREDWDSSHEWTDEPDEAEDPMLNFDSGPDADEEALADPEEEAAATAYYQRADDKRAAAEWARELLQGEFVILDTETTGFEADDEIVQIGIVDQAGAVVLDQLIKPEQPICNSQVHGITDETVKDAPRFPEGYERLKAALEGRTVLAYNLEFDQRLLTQVCHKHQLQPIDFSQRLTPQTPNTCVMEMYAQFNGEWNEYHGNYRWKKLREAMTTFGLEFEGKEHNAVADAKATLAVIRTMAQYGTVPIGPPATINEGRDENVALTAAGAEG